ncbi:M61 family metallopeptidase [Leeia oryzae]|uniref:M61 family metallopeptidase n=1 Tax=Leeia oryzae TaxID=356662 RepID=UPI00035E925E|nr:PDZ domain-containing protein [Leeia oryzae]
MYQVAYRLSLSQPHAHLIDVELDIQHPASEGQKLFLPTWIPGSYLVREFSRQIVTISATCGQVPVAIRKLDKASWQLSAVSGPVTVRYQVYAFDESVRTAYFDADRAFLNPAALCLGVEGQTDVPASLEIIPPAGDAYQQWEVATGLPRENADQLDDWSFAPFVASNYDHLIDCPLECGVLERYRFDVCGTPHDMVISGGHYGDAKRLLADTASICETQIRFFAEDAAKPAAPYARYVFLLNLVADGYGGLEHRNSTALIANRADMPGKDEPVEPTSGYQQLLGLISHEYFHNWNVKRLKPAAYAPYDLSREAYSRLLWAFEGITSYYDDLMLVRAGVISESQYLETLARNITNTLRSPGALKQSLEDASFDAWIKYYRQDENSPNALASYYVKGGLFACLLDLTLRKQGKSLDGIMLALWHRVGKLFDQTGQGLDESAWEQMAIEVTGLPLQSFFDTHLRTASDVVSPLLALLPEFGVAVQKRIAEGSTDKGGKYLAKVPKAKPVLGARLGADALGIRVQTVYNQSATEKAGLHVGDILIALDHVKLTHGSLDATLGRYQPGQTVTVHAFRKDALRSFALTLDAPAEDTVGLQVNQDLPVTSNLRQAWLKPA